MVDIIDWNSYFLQIAEAVSLKSKDPTTKVGAVIVSGQNNSILSTGWNGFPRNIEDDENKLFDREAKLRFTIHAEMNAILNSARNGVRIEGSILYVTKIPCHQCALAIIQSGITVVAYKRDLKFEDRWSDSVENTKNLFYEAGVRRVGIF
jgi:dCMP deaminase